jgi:hypothetical protein
VSQEVEPRTPKPPAGQLLPERAVAAQRPMRQAAQATFGRARRESCSSGEAIRAANGTDARRPATPDALEHEPETFLLIVNNRRMIGAMIGELHPRARDEVRRSDRLQLVWVLASHQRNIGVPDD